MNDTMLSFRVELSIKCPEYKNPLPLDGPLETVYCDNCSSDISFTRDYWVKFSLMHAMK